MKNARKYRALKRTVWFATVILAVATTLSLFFGGGLTHRGWSVGVGNGVFSLAHVQLWNDAVWLPNISGPHWPYGVSGMLWLPSAGPFYGGGTGWMANLPLWIPLLAFTIVSCWLWHRDRRVVPPGCCRTCRYDLTGNTSGVCPECGTGI